MKEGLRFCKRQMLRHDGRFTSAARALLKKSVARAEEHLNAA
jgi:hypothetical protein